MAVTVTVTKILNKTDLGLSGSHGGLVVTAPIKQTLKAFFVTVGKEWPFLDKRDMKDVFMIHYQDYTSNKVTPNDRVTPIGKYAGKYGLKPGNILVFQKKTDNGKFDFFIDYEELRGKVIFEGKSKQKMQVLNPEQLQPLLSGSVINSTVKNIAVNEAEMDVVYQGIAGRLRIVMREDEDWCEIYFDDEPISGNRKYFELDMTEGVFVLRRRETWGVSIEADPDDIAANDGADAGLISALADMDLSGGVSDYTPVPEEKGSAMEIKGRMVPTRNKTKAENALARAGFSCELGGHETFLRRKDNITYTEPHHLIPLHCDNLFEYSLDVEANIVSLCSNCHNKLHYGAEAEAVLRELWEMRENELKAAGLTQMKDGIEVTVETLLGFYGIR